jgi:hypothetical protein
MFARGDRVSIVASIKAMRTPWSAARMRCCASIMSVMTSERRPVVANRAGQHDVTPWSMADFPSRRW